MEKVFTYDQVSSDLSCLSDIGSLDKIKIECTQCKKHFYRRKKVVLRSIDKKGFACSNMCRSKLNGRTIEKQCSNCFKDIQVSLAEVADSGRNYCSRSCAAMTNNKGKQKNPPRKRQCKQCKSDFYVGTAHKSINHCQSCLTNNPSNANFYKQKTKGDYVKSTSSKQRGSFWINSRIRLFCKSWNSDLINLPCQKCGYSIHTELCHIKPLSTFDDSALLGDMNHPDNILVLCGNHHWELDNGYLPLEEIPMRQGQTSRVVYHAKKSGSASHT